MQQQSDRAGDKYRDGEEKQKTLVSLHLDAEYRHVADNRTSHDSECQERACPDKPRRQQEDRGNQLDDARPDSPPRFRADLGEDIDRLRRLVEFEEQRLQQD